MRIIQGASVVLLVVCLIVEIYGMPRDNNGRGRGPVGSPRYRPSDVAHGRPHIVEYRFRRDLDVDVESSSDEEVEDGKASSDRRDGDSDNADGSNTGVNNDDGPVDNDDDNVHRVKDGHDNRAKQNIQHVVEHLQDN